MNIDLGDVEKEKKNIRNIVLYMLNIQIIYK